MAHRSAAFLLPRDSTLVMSIQFSHTEAQKKNWRGRPQKKLKSATAVVVSGFYRRDSGSEISTLLRFCERKPDRTRNDAHDAGFLPNPRKVPSLRQFTWIPSSILAKASAFASMRVRERTLGMVVCSWWRDRSLYRKVLSSSVMQSCTTNCAE